MAIIRSRYTALTLSFIITFFAAVSPAYLSAIGWRHGFDSSSGYENVDSNIKRSFLSGEARSTESRYKELFKYFLRGFIEHRSPEGALIQYSGAGGIYGQRVDDLEGFSRFFPLAATWLYSATEKTINIDDKEIDLINILSEGIISGTNPGSREYWGDMGDYDQRIVEASDIALGLWISHRDIWDKLSAVERDRIVTWLEQTIDKEVYDNNWLLFPVITLKSLQGLGVNRPRYEQIIQEKYQSFKQRHYIGEGWFDDPPKGIDYYNAWAIHYTLFWLDQIDPEFDSAFIRSTHAQFLSFYKYLFGKNGFPAMGRSTCYRLAAPAPLITGVMIAPEMITPGLAYRALDSTWAFFINNGALVNGNVTQGYCGENLNVLDIYSGPGSCLWSLRSLIAAFYVNAFVPFWNLPPEKLPVETSDFVVTNSLIGWQIKGDNATQHIELILLKNQGNDIEEVKSRSFVDKFLELALRSPRRPDNTDALYKRPKYSTQLQVVECDNI